VDVCIYTNMGAKYTHTHIHTHTHTHLGLVSQQMRKIDAGVCLVVVVVVGDVPFQTKHVPFFHRLHVPDGVVFICQCVRVYVYVCESVCV
jgi:hypothetical protein